MCYVSISDFSDDVNVSLYNVRYVPPCTIAQFLSCCAARLLLLLPTTDEDKQERTKKRMASLRSPSSSACSTLWYFVFFRREEVTLSSVPYLSNYYLTLPFLPPPPSRVVGSKYLK